MSAARGGPPLVHRWVAPGSGAPPLTLLLLHGTGGGEDDLIPLGRALAPGAALLSPRGAVDENGLPRFFRRLAEGVFDIPDLTARTHQLADFVLAAARAYAFDARRVVAVGFSNGANIAGALLQLRPELLAGAVQFRPMVPLVPASLPDLAGVPVLVAAGVLDPIVPRSQAERWVALLESEGAEVTLRWEPAGHSIARAEAEAARAWLAERFALPARPPLAPPS
ncbi:MAG TPA: alpha/beta hydrolase [Thermoanaerobaculaceae bacterium]|nr:alpha/beta hydrolase [Thermoanaerobaculaceae bacterium]